MNVSEVAESFRGLVLRLRGRTGLTQRQLAARLGVDRRTVQDWEAGLKNPTANRLQDLIAVLLAAGGFSSGHEVAEASELWAAVLREAPRMHTPFDRAWFDSLLAERAARSEPVASEVMPAAPAPRAEVRAVERAQDWGEVPDVLDFVGRADELGHLRRWVLDEHCRLLAILGMGGIGKTSLVAKLAQDLAPGFERVYWRSLRDAPPLTEWLAGAIGFLSDQQLVPPAADSEGLALLLQLLRDRRCLLVLDNLETVFKPGEEAGRYREGMAGYGHLLQAVGEAPHQSCLVVTSREAPAELAVLGGGGFRTLALGGLAVEEVQVLLRAKELSGTVEEWTALNARFGGNGLALRIIGESIRELFGSDIGAFLEDPSVGSVFGGVRRLLTEQVQRSSTLEQRVLRAVAVERAPVRLPALLAGFGARVGRGAVMEALEALRRRSLLERAEMPGAAAFTLQSVVLEYVTERLVEDVAEEIQQGQPVVLVEQSLLNARAKDYVRQSQERVIGTSILQRLNATVQEGSIERRLLELLAQWRGETATEQGYGPGNVVNLLRLLRGDLRRLDLSRLVIRQAYLAEVEAQDASLACAQLADSVLPEAFDFPGSIAVSADGALLATGTQTGQVWLWRVADRTPLLALQGHTAAVWGVALSADGHLLASGGADGIVRLWDTTAGRPVATLRHTGVIRSVALSADGALLASAGTDGTVRLWDTVLAMHRDSGPSAERRQPADLSLSETAPVATLQGHTGGVYRLALSAEGRMLASAGTDGVVRLWETRTARPGATLQGDVGRVRTVALSADGHLLAAGDTDGIVRLWETTTGRSLSSLKGHTAEVHGVALSAKGNLLASGGADGAARVWETSSGQPVATCRAGVVWGVAMPADGQLVVSGGTDGAVRLWDTNTGQPVATLQGHTGTIRSVALSADGRVAASGGEDAMVRLWDAGSGQLVVTLRGHTSGVLAVAVSGDGQFLASGSGDGTVRLWDVGTGRPLQTLRGHAGGIRSVALCGDGYLVASGGTDGTVRLWETSGGQAVAMLPAHAGEVRGVALSAGGDLLASGGADGVLRLWETRTGKPVATFQGHAGELWG
ncbi:MAG: helix-turn-helix domain-containing protein, partial [Chloroflexi bacterium]|nr:helix-turn-helix domain-containing protein [Chloroflexota bacterium]